MSTYLKPGQQAPPEQYDNCPTFLDTYLHYRSVLQGVSPSTVVQDYLVISEFCQYLRYTAEEGVPPATADAHSDMDISTMELGRMFRVHQEDILDYLDFLSGTVGNSTATLIKKQSLLRTFFSYLDSIAGEFGTQWAQGEDPMKNVQVERGKDPPLILLTKNQMEQLLLPASEFLDLRDRAMIHLLICTGITVSELVQLNRSDLNHQILTIRSGKQPRQMFLPEACAASIWTYLEWLDASPYASENKNTPLFVTERSSRRMTSRAVQLRIPNVAAAAGLEKLGITASILRDSCVALLLRENSEYNRSQVFHYMGVKGDARKRFNEVKSKPSSDFSQASMFSNIAGSSLAQIGAKKQ